MDGRPRQLWIACACGCASALAACDTEVFDHTPHAVTRDAGSLAAPQGGGCEGAEDGTPCDDRDVCTPASSCRDGRCAPGNAFDSCVVADSEADFGDTQGEAQWFYGYWNAEADRDGSYDSLTDFSEMAYCGENTWRPPEVCGVGRDEPGYRWTMNLAWGLQHPETRPGLELPVRRWVSDVSGPARVTLLHGVGGSTGDGTRALLLVDGSEVWRHDAEPDSDDPTMDELELELEVGTVVEQIVHPIRTSGDDMTYFEMRIEGTVVP